MALHLRMSALSKRERYCLDEYSTRWECRSHSTWTQYVTKEQIKGVTIDGEAHSFTTD